MIPRQQVADTLQQDLSADGSEVGRVDCAQDLPSEVGSTGACTAVTGANSQVYDVTVTQGVGDTIDLDYRAR